jgi:hypothetical protein
VREVGSTLLPAVVQARVNSHHHRLVNSAAVGRLSQTHQLPAIDHVHPAVSGCEYVTNIPGRTCHRAAASCQSKELDEAPAAACPGPSRHHEACCCPAATALLNCCTRASAVAANGRQNQFTQTVSR